MIHPQWRIVLTITPYAVLALLAVHSILAARADEASVLPTLLLVLFAAAWVLVLRDLPGTARWRDRPAAVALFLTGLIALTFALSLRDSTYGVLTIACYTSSYACAPWPWRLIPIGATSVVAGLAQGSGLGDDGARPLWIAGLILGNAVLMCGLAWGLNLAREQSERTATEVERSRLAREIHDTLAQGFAGIVTQLQAAEQSPDDATRRRHLDSALDLAREGLGEARRSVNALRPVALETMRLADAVRQLAASWSTRTGIPVEVDIDGDGRRLPIDVEVALLRTAQEALANVDRHAVASRVVVSLRSDVTGASLQVRDDGRGFDAGSRRDARAAGDDLDGYGLIAMRERLESVAGDLVVSSRPGHGTRVSAEVPA